MSEKGRINATDGHCDTHFTVNINPYIVRSEIIYLFNLILKIIHCLIRPG